MGNENEAKGVGFVNPFGVTPAFVIPVFVFHDQLCAQVIDVNDKVANFSELEEHEKASVERVTIEAAIDRRMPAIYGFAFANGDLIFGDRQDLASSLNQRLKELEDSPYVYMDVVNFLNQVLPLERDVRQYLNLKAVSQVVNSMSRYDQNIANRWLNSELLSGIIEHTDIEGYINYLDLLNEIERLTKQENECYIRLKLIRSTIGVSKKFRNQVQAFGFSSPRINSESSWIPIDFSIVSNLKEVRTHLLVVEVQIGSNMGLTIHATDTNSIRKRYFKKNQRKNVKSRKSQDYKCEVFFRKPQMELA